ncbi:hypothetical protein ABEB36_001308 [Hypothenemus hampei]|uniref:CCZ1/INTU/HSP4 first Longin domain-containing protein n=1 Tax=Hypothenemus hampei TaxID=57062 RepID=A0ABD1FE49_HYPHA
MSKESNIIFLYDTELLRREEDDPNSAILYFYPSWVSDQQKTALCGQLMGTLMCSKNLFCMPKHIALQTGKFYFIENGRYIFVVGCDRNIPDWVLEHRAHLIYGLIKFFHKDFVTLGQTYDRENLSIKLYHIFDTYLKLLYLHGNIFNFMPLMDTSKVDADVHLRVRNFLNDLITVKHCLGGLVLYHNKVIRSELSEGISKKIVFSDPYHIKNPAELCECDLTVPQEVRLLRIHISDDEYVALLLACPWKKMTINQILDQKNFHKNDYKLSSPLEEAFTNTTSHAKKISRPNSLILCDDCHCGKPKSAAVNTWSQSSTVLTPLIECKSFVDPPELNGKKHELNANFKNNTCSDLLKNFKFYSLRNLHSISSEQYSISKMPENSKNRLRRCKSVNDPLFPWFSGNHQISQYCMLERTKTMVHKTRKRDVEERKKSLILPIKPHNASEPSKSDLKSLGGYCTPLMNKLYSCNSSEKPPSTVPSLPNKNSNHKTEKGDNVRECILFIYGEKDLVVAQILAHNNEDTLQKLVSLFSKCIQ